MPLANLALVLVTDGRKTLFFRNHGDVNQIDLRTEAHEEREEISNDDMNTHGSGAAPSPNRDGESTYEGTDPHQLQEDRWAKTTAEAVNKRALAHDFEALAIIAPPKTMGQLRKQLHKEAARRVVCEISKEMTGRPIPDIEALIVGHTKADEPADV